MKLNLHMFDDDPPATPKYIVTEECLVNVNNNPIHLHKNAKLVLTPNGVPKAVQVADGGTEIEMSAAVQNLIDQGILVAIEAD